MESLKSLMDAVICDLPDCKYGTIDEFITEDQKSAEFISMMTGGFTFGIPDENSALYSVAKGRARHSAITFLMGLVLKKIWWFV